MARAAAKKKRDVPALYMLVADGGRLDPAFQHDQERLMSFRRGTRLVVTVEPDGSRRGVRKWHAIIGKAVKNGLLPWLTASAADEGLRLALDMYDPKKAKDGSWHRITQSLSDLTDEELDEKIELMTGLIYKLSGVDPDDFQRELAGAGDERFASDYDRPAAANDAGSATNSDEATNQAMVLEAETDSAGDPASNSAASAPNSNSTMVEPPQGAVVDSPSVVKQAAEVAPHSGSAGATLSSGEEKAAGDVGSALTIGGASPAAELSEADRAWLKFGAHQMLAALPADEPDALRVLIVQTNEIRKVMPKDVGRDALQRMETMRIHCRNVCDGKEKLDKAYMADRALATPAEIEPKPIKTSRAAS